MSKPDYVNGAIATHSLSSGLAEHFIGSQGAIDSIGGQ